MLPRYNLRSRGETEKQDTTTSTTTTTINAPPSKRQKQANQQQEEEQESIIMQAAAKQFFSSPKFAVAGASSNPSKFGYKSTLTANLATEYRRGQ